MTGLHLHGVHFGTFDTNRVFISYTDVGLFVSEDGGRTRRVRGTGTGPISPTWIVLDEKSAKKHVDTKEEAA